MKFDDNYFKIIYPKIIEALRLVAAPAEDQLNLLPDYVCKPDEVALVFEEILTYAKIVMENNFLSSDLYDHLVELDNMFNGFAKEDWTEDAMCRSNMWKTVRYKAMEILNKFDEVYTYPNLFWITDISNNK